jgi:hypothetical protein
MSKASEKEASKREAVDTLRKMGLKPGSAVYTSITYVARSGMSRHVRVYMVTRNTSSRPTKRIEHAITDITGLVANACGMRRATGSAWDIVVGGCGFDAGFHVVYGLGRTMFPKGGDLKHSPRKAQEERLGEKRERDGGYLLTHRSLWDALLALQ